MEKRVISGAVYTAILVGFYCLKIFVHDICFDALLYAFALIGTFEILRAFGENTTKWQRILTYAYAAVCIPACALAESFFSFGLQATCLTTLVFALALLSLLVFRNEETDINGTGHALLGGVYPTLLLSALVLVNHAPVIDGVGLGSDLLILFVFVISPLADVFAFLFGISLKKVFPKKLAPTLSPNKTVIGFIGGLLGGIVAATALYFVYGAIVGGFENTALWLPVYMAIGLLVALATAFGDLIESCIKRKVGIKDMGKIMPGHGGVLDRIDGTLLSAFVVYAAYLLLALLI